MRVDFAAEFDNKDLEKPDLMALMDLPMGKVYRKLEERAGEFGHLPLMAAGSTGQIGALLSESFCERVLSCANDVMTDGNTLLADEELEMLVVLRMNRDFMKRMRKKYPRLSRQQFKQTVVRVADLLD